MQLGQLQLHLIQCCLRGPTGAGNMHFRQKSFPDSFLRWCKASPSSPLHIARRRVGCLAFLCFFFFFFPSPRMPLEMRCLISVAVAAAALKISPISKYSLLSNRTKNGLLSRHRRNCPAGSSLRCV